MGFLILSRREGEGITLSLKADYPAEELIRQLREGGIRILVTDIIGNQARVGIEAPRPDRSRRVEDGTERLTNGRK